MELRLKDVAIDHRAMQITMPIVSNHDGELRCIGTAFAVAPGLAITADHVADDWQNYQEMRDGYKRTDAKYSVSSFQWCEGSLWEWRVDGIYVSKSADIAFLRFIRPEWWGTGQGQIQPAWARLSFNPPDVGDEVRVFGFPESHIEDGILTISPSECIARVRHIELLSQGGARPYSHVELDGETLGGMSGGPCFDKNWNVVGVNSRGWTFLDAPPISYMALLWPAMNVEIDLFRSGKFPAAELFKEGLTRAVGHQRIYVTSERQVQFSRVDPEQMIPIGLFSHVESLEQALNFAAGNAHSNMVVVQEILTAAEMHSSALVTDDLLRHLRTFFWELETALYLAIHIAAILAELPLPFPFKWEELLAGWQKKNPDTRIRDELASLAFAWEGIGLFEIRVYAEQSRSSLLLVRSVCEGERVVATSLGPCWRKGPQTPLPSGLEIFYTATRRFVGRLLRLSRSG
jgi:hypothetical protein